MRSLQDFELGEAVYFVWVPGTEPEVLQFEGLTPSGSILLRKKQRYGSTRHELWPDENIGIGDSPESALRFLELSPDIEV